jgi:hypothetical protein
MPFGSTYNSHPTATLGIPLRIEDVELGMEPGSRARLFTHQDESKRNLTDALRTVFETSGFSLTDEVSDSTLRVSVQLLSTASSDGLSGSWENAQLRVVFHRGDKLVHTWSKRAKRRGRGAPATFTRAVNACVDELHKAMTAKQWARVWSESQ